MSGSAAPTFCPSKKAFIHATDRTLAACRDDGQSFVAACGVQSGSRRLIYTRLVCCRVSRFLLRNQLYSVGCPPDRNLFQRSLRPGRWHSRRGERFSEHTVVFSLIRQRQALEATPCWNKFPCDCITPPRPCATVCRFARCRSPFCLDYVVRHCPGQRRSRPRFRPRRSPGMVRRCYASSAVGQ